MRLLYSPDKFELTYIYKVSLLAPTVYFAAKTGLEFVQADYAPTPTISVEYHNTVMDDLAPGLAFDMAEFAMIAAAVGLGKAVRDRVNGEWILAMRVTSVTASSFWATTHTASV
jgi:hypothetical protein